MSDNQQLAAYLLRFVVSEREHRKIARRCSYNLLNVDQDVMLASVAKSGDGLHKFVRGETRVWISTFGLLRLIEFVIARRRGAKVDLAAKNVATTLLGISSIYRVVYFLMTRLVQKKQEIVNSRLKLSPRKQRRLRQVNRLAIPIISGLLAGSAFSVFPQAAKTYAALYVATRALEFLYNYVDDLGLVDFKPRVLGSWALFPFSFSQLFFTYIFDRESCPNTFSRVMQRLSTGYIPERPSGYPDSATWPNIDTVVGSIAVVARARYPKFESPIIYPHAKFPAELAEVQPVLSMAHPAITTLTGAITHPTYPSEFRVFAELVLNKYSTVSRYVFALYAAMGLIKLSRRRQAKASNGDESKTPNNLLDVVISSVANTIRTTTFIVMTVASAWSGIGLAQQMLNNKFIPVYRYRIIGFMAGLWAFADQVNGHGRYMYALRLALLSYWNTVTKNVRAKKVGFLAQHGETALFAVSFAVIMTLFDLSPGSTPGKSLRKVLNWVKQNKYEDPVFDENNNLRLSETEPESDLKKCD